MVLFGGRTSQYLLLLLLSIVPINASKYWQKIPENNHGIQPTTIVNEAEDLQPNNLVLFIPILSNEWIVQLHFKLLAEHAGESKWCNIIHVTKGQNNIVYGDRTPAIFFDKTTMRLGIGSAVNGSKNYARYPTVQYNTEYNVEIHQRDKSGGVYKYSILLNGEEIHSIDNTQAQQFYDMKVYISDPWFPACNGWIKHVKITNFL
uniref:Cnidarian restricted protein n=1 Tax=Clytia hemisphaerica TaxID=252671 RepID=A0A7M5V1R0_9CNID